MNPGRARHAQNDLFLARTGKLIRSGSHDMAHSSEDSGMVRRIVALGLLCGSLACAQPASAQGLWFGGFGMGGPGFYGPGLYGPGFGSGFSPYGFGNAAFFGAYPPARFGYPVVARPVYVARPVIYGGIAPAYVPRPVVRAPLNRAYRRVWRRGW
jgi:hypothetical protein